VAKSFKSADQTLGNDLKKGFLVKNKRMVFGLGKRANRSDIQWFENLKI